MYCTTCDKVLSGDAAYCPTCGTKLVPLAEVDLPLAYYAKLVQVLGERGFCMDPALLDKSQGADSMKLMMRLQLTFSSGASEFPGVKQALNTVIGPVARFMARNAAFDGDRVFNAFLPLAQDFELLATRYHMMNMQVVGAINADGLTPEEAKRRTQALGDALGSLFDDPEHKPRAGISWPPKQAAETYVLMVYFDSAQAEADHQAMLKACGLTVRGKHRLARAIVLPVVIDVPGRQIHAKGQTKLNLQLGRLGWPINMKVLQDAFP
jgi:hypothetical protein